VEQPNRAEQPFTDDELANVTVGEPTRLDGQIELSDPDPAWPDLFLREAERIRSVLGDRVLLLEHVGSTSVPGLIAKPRIDIVVAVADSADEAEYVPALEVAGYLLRIREPDWHEHRMLIGPDTEINLHVFTVGNSEIVRMIAFRDHLRDNPADLRLYAETKRELANRTWKYVQNYADAKSAVVEDIMSRVPTS
jgi:GrpB-like predicted nucleotidyltransferase (UPF0157 family)